MTDSIIERTPEVSEISWWRGDALAGMACCAIGLAVFGAYYWLNIREGLWVALACYVLGAMFLLRASRRWNGKRVEASALKQLARRMPKNWGLTPNVRVPGLGDCDGYVVVDQTAGYCLEIKSTRSVVYKNVLMGREKLTDRRGRPLHKDPVAQAKAVAKRLSAEPVLWFPRANPPTEVRMRCGVLLVLGNEKQLIRAINRWHARR